jgi:Fe-Mn family superoxide dismutase
VNIKKRIRLLQVLAAKGFSLPYKSIPGVISAKALDEHIKLYEGYKALLKRVDEELKTADLPKKHMPDHPFRALKDAETHALGGVLLHELYFENLTNKPSSIKGLEIEKCIKDQFGSMAEWKQCMRAVCLTVGEGWAVMAMNDEKDCRILMVNGHNAGTMFGYEPLIVIDEWCHAYFLEWGADKAGYTDAVLECLNWDAINQRYLSV